MVNKKPEIIQRIRGLKDVVEAFFEEDIVKVIVKSRDYKIEDVLMILRESGSQIINMTIDQPNLETVFLSLTGRQLRN